MCLPDVPEVRYVRGGPCGFASQLPPRLGEVRQNPDPIAGYRNLFASCVRHVTSSFRNALRRWYSTVLGLMNRCAAISRFVLPSAARRETCASCGVSWSSVAEVRFRACSPVA